MKIYIKYCCLVAILILGSVGLLQAQNNTATQAYLSEKIELKSFDAEAWKAASNGMKYSKKPKAQKKKKRTSTTSAPPRPRPNAPDFSFRDLAQTLLIFLAVLLLAFVVFRIVAGDAILVNKQVTNRRPVTLQEIETNLHDADVDGFLDQALKKTDYRLAIRLYYLAIIKELSLKGVIEWKKDKTNGHYMREMRSKKHEKLSEFRNVTRIFEYVWYSDIDNFDAGQFEEVRVEFKRLLTAVKS